MNMAGIGVVVVGMGVLVDDVMIAVVDVGDGVVVVGDGVVEVVVGILVVVLVVGFDDELWKTVKFDTFETFEKFPWVSLAFDRFCGTGVVVGKAVEVVVIFIHVSEFCPHPLFFIPQVLLQYRLQYDSYCGSEQFFTPVSG
jgi:hypothetical protein